MPEPYNSLEAKAWTPVESIPLNEAVLCVNCNCITRARNHHCPVCDSTALIKLSEMLDRDENAGGLRVL